MKPLIAIVSILLIFGSLTISGLLVEGPCRYNEITPLKSLDLAAYMGTWYELERYELDLRQNSDCIKLEMTSSGGQEFDSAESGFNYFEGKNYAIQAKGVVPQAGDAKLAYSYEGQPAPEGTNYWVLDTDYKNFAIIWGCQEVAGGNSSEYYATLSREKRLTTDRTIRERIMKVIDTAEIDVRFIRITVQESDVCP
uniref:CSON004382 protein n=1 Tax=Culicoides sonorensis TaxID=179676 RepID=A0A336MSF8_CULSO